MIRFVAIMIATENGISEKEIVKSKSSENECNEAAAKTIPNNIESKAESWATQLLKLRIALDQASSLTVFAEILAKQLVRILKCRNVFVGICKGMGEVDLVGIESDDFSSESSLEVVRNAAREVALGQVCVGWPRNNRWSPSLVHRELVSAAHSTAFSVAIRAGDGDVMGIVTVVITEKQQCARISTTGSNLSIACTTDGVSTPTRKISMEAMFGVCHWQYHAVSALVGWH